MSNCKIDPALQDQVHRFISDSGLATDGAAGNLGINRTAFWRCCDTGKAYSKYEAATPQRSKK